MSESLSALAADATGKLYVLGHDGDTLAVDGAEVGVLKETHYIGLGGLLKGGDGGTLKAEISLEAISRTRR